MNKSILSFLLALLPFCASSQMIVTIAGTGAAGYTGDGGKMATAEFNSPLSIKFDRWGNMFVADQLNHVVRKVTPNGTISTFAGIGVSGYSGDMGPASTAALSLPADIAFDTAGNLYIADGGNHVIRKVDTGRIITTFAGSGTQGFAGDGGPAIAAKMYDPVGIVIDSMQNVYFSDGGNARVRKVDPAGNIWTIAGTGIAGYSGDDGPATDAQLSIPNYLGIDTADNIYIPDIGNHRVRKINTVGVITTVAGTGSGGNGLDGLPATAVAMGSPNAVLCDTFGNLYISSFANCIIRKVNVIGIAGTVVGYGNCGYGGDNGSPATAQINQQAICSYVDGAGNLYIADSKNFRLRKVIKTVNGVNAVSNTQTDITIYPNPTQSELTITSSGKIDDIRIVNAVGAAFAEGSSLGSTLFGGATIKGGITLRHDREAVLDVKRWPAGIYFVRVNGLYAGRFLKE